MNVELFIHGVPHGQDFLGIKTEQPYFDLFYDHSADEVKFLIQKRSLENKSFCYYNYLVYRDVIDSEGRPGSYFGISLRLDAYCIDIVNMYRILDTIYNVFVMGTLVKKEGNKIKYIISNFASASKDIEGIRSETIQMLRKAFTNKDFVNLDNSFQIGDKGFACNLYDYTQERFYALFKQYGKIAISPYYSTEKEKVLIKQSEAQVNELHRQFDQQMKSYLESSEKDRRKSNDALMIVQDQVQKLQVDLAERDRSIDQLNVEIKKLKEELKSVGQSKDISEIVSTIKEPIFQLSDSLRRIMPDTSGQKIPKKKVFNIELVRKHLFLFIALFVVISLTVLLYSFRNKLPFGDTEKQGSPNEALYSIPQDTQKVHSDIQMSNTNIEKDININIVGNDGDDLKKQNIYEVKAENGVSNGSWRIEGCLITYSDDNNVIKIKPIESKVNISYYIGKEKKKEKSLNAN